MSSGQRSNGLGGLAVVGLTGGIAAGKSTVAEMFRELGAAVVDADALARQVVLPGTPALQQLVRALGAQILDDAGALDRQTLGAMVFRDGTVRATVEQITHPAIAAAAQQAFEALRQQGRRLVLYEAALLVETGRHQEMDRLVVVVAEPERRIERLMARNGLRRADAEARLAAQLPQEHKARLADYVIDNSGPLEQTRAQVAEVWRRLAPVGRRSRSTTGQERP